MYKNNINIFNAYSEEILEKQLLALKECDYMVGSKLARLKILNDNLDAFKEKLQYKMDLILLESTSISRYDDLKFQLSEHYKKYVIEYLSKSFLAEN